MHPHGYVTDYKIGRLSTVPFTTGAGDASTTGQTRVVVCAAASP